MSAVEPSSQPCLSETQIVPDDMNRNARDFAGLFGGHPGERMHLNQAGHLRILLSQFGESCVQFDQVQQLQPFSPFTSRIAERF